MRERLQHREQEAGELNKSHFEVEVEIGEQSCRGELIVLPLRGQPVEPLEDTQTTEILFLYPESQLQALFFSRKLVEGVFSGRTSTRGLDSKFGSRQKLVWEVLPDGFFYKYSGIVWKREPWQLRDWLLREGVPWEKRGPFSLAASLSRQPDHWVPKSELMEYLSTASHQERAESFIQALDEHSSGMISMIIE